MKRYTYILLLCLCPLYLAAQWKIIEKSHKEQPVWIGGVERNYLITSAEATTLEEAKEKVLQSLRDQVINAIATHITSHTVQQRQETVIGNTYNYSETTSSFITSKARNIPFISEISLSKATDYYWLKLYNKKTKVYKYEYHVKYRFTDFELSDLINRFNEHEEKLNKRLKDYEDKLSLIDYIEDIDLIISELNTFQAEFTTDDPRKGQTVQLSNNFRKLYNQIRIQPEEENKKGELLFRLYLQNKPIQTNQKPQLRSNCANRLSSKVEGDLHTIHYDDSGCYPDDDNYIEVRFRFGNKFTTHKFYLP